MALSRSLLEYGHDEDRDDEVCSYCASDGKLQPALYFCFDCGVYGKFICGKCLRHHNKFLNKHGVEKIKNRSASKRAQENDIKIKALQLSNEELQKENATLKANLKEVSRENEELSKELHDYKTAEQLKIGPNMKVNKCERDAKRKESKLVYKEKDNSQIRQRKPADGTNSGIERAKRDKLIVVAIKVDNKWSSYAYSFRLNFPEKLFLADWGSFPVFYGMAPQGKTLSVVLFDENKKFDSFGFEANGKYEELIEEGKHHKWFFFKDFMMKFSGRDITRNIEIDDDKGRKMKAIDVFGAVIKYIKDHLLGLLKRRGTEVLNEDIHWVLTVRALWKDSGKQLMRDAAYKADIAASQLTIVTEPEAAIAYYQMESKSIMSLTTFDISIPGITFMVIDIGGKTADFTILERQSESGLLEIKAATGLPCGEKMVIEEFRKLICNITGDDAYQEWIDEYDCDQTEFQRVIEEKIISTKNIIDGFQTFRVPFTINHVLEEINHESLGQAIERSQYKGRIKLRESDLKIDMEIVQNLFKPCTDMIVDHIQHLLKESEPQEKSIFLMVGMFSKSSIVREAIIKAFPTVNVNISQEPSTVVLKGAVIYGNQHYGIS